MSCEPSVRQPKSNPAIFTPAGGGVSFFCSLVSFLGLLTSLVC